MTSEIQKELENNVKEMDKLISKQKFKVGDAQKFLERYFNIVRKMEDLESSRDNWRNKCKKLSVSISNAKVEE